MKKLNRKITIISNILLVVIFSIVFAISFLPESIESIYGGSRINAIYNGNRAKADVSLMFNVYENTEVVNGILDVLKENNVKATFFVGGCWADDNGQTLTRIVSEGHELANHGYFHKDHKLLDYQKNKSEIENTGKIVKALCGMDLKLFAPPSGSFSDTTLEVADELGYKVIMWSKDTIDWRDKDENLIFKRATNGLENGDLILMHPKAHTLAVLPKILDFYKSVNFSVVTVSENLA